MVLDKHSPLTEQHCCDQAFHEKYRIFHAKSYLNGTNICVYLSIYHHCGCGITDSMDLYDVSMLSSVYSFTLCCDVRYALAVVLLQNNTCFMLTVFPNNRTSQHRRLAMQPYSVCVRVCVSECEYVCI